MTQIKASELRIGNLVQSGNGIYTVSAISDEGIHFIRCLKTGKVFDATSLSLIITPVPLTEEWLLRFGFVYIMGSYVYSIKPSTFLGCIHHKGDTSFLGKVGNSGIYQYRFDDVLVMSEFQYVHQLQNLFHALTGQELTITQ